MTFFSSKNMYIRTSLILLIIVTVVVSLLSLVLSKLISNYSFLEINRFTQDKMEQSIQNTDFVLNRLWEYSFRIYTDQRVQKYLSSYEKTPFNELDVAPTIMNYLLNEPFIDSVYLINSKNQSIYDSTDGPFTFENFHDKEILRRINMKQYTDFKFYTHDVEDQSFLSLIITSPREWNGYLVMLLNVEKLETYLLQSKPERNIKLMITDASGQLVLGKAEDALINTVEHLTGQQNKGYYELYIDSQPWAVNYSNMGRQGWTFYHITQISSWQGSVKELQKKIIYSSAGVLVILFIVVLWHSRRTYQPFSNLAKKIENKYSDRFQEDPSANKEELKVIEQGFDFLVNQVNKMDSSLREHQKVVKVEYIRQWILQGFIHEPIADFLREETSLLSHDQIHLIVVRIVSYHSFSEKYNLNWRRIMKFAIGNIVEEVLSDQNWAIESVDFGSDHIALLVSTPNQELKHYDQILNNVNRQVEKWLKINVVLAVSNPKTIKDDYRKVYDQMYELTTLNFISGEERIYWETDFKKYVEIIDPILDNSAHDLLIQTVSLGYEDKIGPLLDQLIDRMQKLTFSECNFQLTLIIYSIIKSFNQLTSLKSFEGIQNQLSKFDTLVEVRDWLEYELKQIVENLNMRKSSDRKVELANEVIEYVNTHIHDPVLSVEKIAEHLSLSVSYTRQLFKEVFGDTLSDFVLKSRIEKVKELLLTTDWVISEVADRSGFQTKSHFYTVFKKMVGLTPAEYRQHYSN